MFAFRNITHTSLWPIALCVIFFSADVQSQAPASEQTPAPQQTGDPRHVERLGEVSAEDWEMELALPETQPTHKAKPQSMELPDPDQDRALRELLSALAKDPQDRSTIARLDALLLDVLEQANQRIDEGSINQAEQLLDIVQSVNPSLRELTTARQRIETRNEIKQLLIAGNAAIVSGRFLEPADDNAYFYFSSALEKDPRNPDARQGLTRLQNALLEKARQSATDLDFENADLWLADAVSIQQDQQAVENARAEVANFRSQHAAGLEKKALAAMEAGNFDMADFHIIDLIALGGNDALVESLRKKLKKARLYGGFVPGQLIRDELQRAGGFAPELVVISKGSFLMGTRSGAEQASDHEQPQHRVILSQGFAAGKHEVTVEEFGQFVKYTDFKTTAERRGSSMIYDESAGRMSRRSGVNWRHDYTGDTARSGLPVIHVSLVDAHAYVDWLTRQTGHRYRLLSEAEYEYIARAGGSSDYWWGDDAPPETVENLTGERDRSPSKREWTTFFKRYGDGYWGPGPAGEINDGKLRHPMGIEDIAGNVSEWVEDCWHSNYIKAPTDGAAWVNPGCDQRVVRGGYWASSPDKTRAAYRIPVKRDNYGPTIGFRVARDL